MMILTRRFGALAARPQFPDAPELQRELDPDLRLDVDVESEEVLRAEKRTENAA